MVAFKSKYGWSYCPRCSNNWRVDEPQGFKKINLCPECVSLMAGNAAIRKTSA